MIFTKYTKKYKNKEKVIEALIKIIKRISFNEEKIREILLTNYFSPIEIDIINPVETIRLYGDHHDTFLLNDLILSIQDKNIDSIKLAMKQLTNEVRIFHGLEPLEKCIFINIPSIPMRGVDNQSFGSEALLTSKKKRIKKKMKEK